MEDNKLEEIKKYLEDKKDLKVKENNVLNVVTSNEILEYSNKTIIVDNNKMLITD